MFQPDGGFRLRSTACFPRAWFMSRFVPFDPKDYYRAVHFGRVRMPPKPRRETPIEQHLPGSHGSKNVRVPQARPAAQTQAKSKDT